MPTVADIIELITQTVPAFRADRTIDTLKSATPDTAVRAIAVTFMATRNVLAKAVELGANFIITHEPTYYRHDDQVAGDFAADPVVASKARFIADHNLAIWRCHDTMHWRKPDWIVEGMAGQLGWARHQLADRQAQFDLPPTTLDALAVQLKRSLGIASLRVVGDPALPVRRVALSVGCPGWDTHRAMLRSPGVDVLVCGEVREWETCEYARDTAAAGLAQGLIVLGHCSSEESGMAHLARWLGEKVTGVPVHFLPAGDPFRHV